eukprot:CAMPEP_0206226854 /NCGR_PEP_ID=MMETSP0047_2-20121206/8313_1 /ASSEMBLY_ACC=CAM_ASM_000192 /TAXON_ID=195065 /ORGANISM="Chroomonas mesostigmatica_cf, Strain CCMP1168" /LENGTH=359 /DNA_ID=CAMNT_0053649969 /DNA_START=202 /DNA_END=1281 /DNA_ORIENTATION=-
MGGWQMLLAAGQLPVDASGWIPHGQGGNMLSWPYCNPASSFPGFRPLQLGTNAGVCLPALSRPANFSLQGQLLAAPLPARQPDREQEPAVPARATRAPSEDRCKYTGVSRCGARGRWRAQLSTGGRSIHLGSFATEDEAARAWDLAAVAQRGKRAQTNFDISDYLVALDGSRGKPSQAGPADSITRQKVKELMKVIDKKKLQQAAQSGECQSPAPSPTDSLPTGAGRDTAVAALKTQRPGSAEAEEGLLAGLKRGRGSIDFVLGDVSNNDTQLSKKPAHVLPPLALSTPPTSRMSPQSYASMIQGPSGLKEHRQDAKEEQSEAPSGPVVQPEAMAPRAASNALQQLLALCHQADKAVTR